MSEPFIGEIRMFGGNYAPDGWAFCWGQTMQIRDNAALYSILGTQYGGDGKNTFCLPDLRGRVPYGQGQRPPTSSLPAKAVTIGQMAGRDQVQLSGANMPAHTHGAVFKGASVTPASVSINVTETVGTLKTPKGSMLAKSPDTGQPQALVYAPADSHVDGQLAGVVFTGPSIAGTVTVDAAGGDPQHGTMPFDSTPPYVGINFVISLRGLYPPRP